MDMPDMKILGVDTIIEDSNKFYKELEKFVRYIFYINKQEIFANQALVEMKANVFNFLLLIAEAQDSVSAQEKNYIKKTLEMSDIEKYINVDSTALLKHRKFMFEFIPPYLSTIKTFINGKNHLEIIIDCIVKLGINMAAVDKSYSGMEAKRITEYYEFLTKELVGAYYLDNEDYKRIANAGEKYHKINESENKIGKVTTSDRSLDAVIREFNELIGLKSVKYEINTLINLARINLIRKKNNLKVPELSMHLVFLGNPGTGKTTVARLLSEIYGKLKLLSKGHMLEVTRTDLVGEYVGQTSKKTRDVVEQALGGILFIDEAYAIVADTKEDFGKEAVAELLKQMEDHRDDLVVIVAGYTNEMKKFIEVNPGLKSRFNKYIEFPNYSPDELVDIFKLQLTKNEYVVDDGVLEKLKSFFESIDRSDFANGRGVRNLFEKMIEAQANRIINIPKLTSEELKTLSEDDLEKAKEFFTRSALN